MFLWKFCYMNNVYVFMKNLLYEFFLKWKYDDFKEVKKKRIKKLMIKGKIEILKSQLG